MPKAPMDDVALNQTYAHAVARALVRPLLGTWVRPNHLTILRFAIGLAACGLLAPGTRPAYGASGLCWVVACVLDRADGELARLGDLRSESGKILDYYSDMILDSLWFLGVGIGLSHFWLGTAGTLMGGLVCVCMLLTQWSSEMYERLSGPGIKIWYGVRRFHPDDALFLLAPFTWAGAMILAPILIASAIVVPIVMAVTVWRYAMLRRRELPLRG